VSRRRSTRRLRPRRTSRRKQWRHRRAPRQHALRPLRRAGPAARPRAPRLTHRSRRLVVGLRLTARAERVGVGVGARRALLALLLLVAVAAVGYVAGHGLGSRGSASTSDSPFARACGQVVDAVSRVGQPLGYDLTPVSAYARSLAAVLASVQKGRAAVAQAAGAHGAAADLGGLAARLAQQFRAAAS